MTTATAALEVSNHDRQSSVGADEGNAIGDGPLPSRTEDDIETVPRDRERSPENEAFTAAVHNSSTLSAQGKPKDSVEPPAPIMVTDSCSSLLLCPACTPPVRLVNPTTLHCGHTVCAKHVRTPGQDASSSTPVPPSVTPSPSPEPSPRNERPNILSPSSRRRNPVLDPAPVVPVVPSCPLPTCKPGIRRPVITPNIPRESPVAYYPPIPQSVIEHPNVTVAEPLQDVSIGRILSLIEKVENKEHDLTATEERTGAGSSGSEEDEEDEDSSEEELQRVNTAIASPDFSQRRRLHRTSKAKKRVRSQQCSEGAHHRHTIRKELEAQFKKELIECLTCEICFMLLFEPITTPCQHTFCAKCLQRSLDHNPKCPLCRQTMPPFSYFQDHPLNKVLQSLLLKSFNEEYTERKQALEEEERSGRLKTPIFVAQLSFPGIPTLLHFYEPRYRLMLRRCLESTNPCFGMIMPPRSGGTSSSEYGTMLEIRSVQMLPDGRSMVETMGTYRFRLMETGTLDGYMVGRVERVDDIPEELEEEAERAIASLSSNTTDSSHGESSSSSSPLPTIPCPCSPTTEELMAVCHAFVEQLRNGTAPWVVQRLNNTYGPMPSDANNFGFWMAQVLPIDEHEKAKLLIIRSAKCRLRLVVHWIEQLNSNWWFSSGCTIN